MTTPVIIDVIMAVVLIAAVIYGAHRGLFRALAGLAVVIVALVGAAIIANTLAAPAARLVTPLIREQIETKVDEAMARQSQEVQMPEEDVDEGFAIEDLLALMGLDEDVRNSLASQTQEKIQDTGVSLVMAVVEDPQHLRCRTVSGGAVYGQRGDLHRGAGDLCSAGGHGLRPVGSDAPGWLRPAAGGRERPPVPALSGKH